MIATYFDISTSSYMILVIVLSGISWYLEGTILVPSCRSITVYVWWWFSAVHFLPGLSFEAHGFKYYKCYRIDLCFTCCGNAGWLNVTSNVHLFVGIGTESIAALASSRLWCLADQSAIFSGWDILACLDSLGPGFDSSWNGCHSMLLYVTMVSYAFLGCFMIHWISLTFRHFSFALDFAMKSGKPWFMAPTSMCQSTIALLHVMWECFGWRKRLSRSYPCTWSSAISLLRRGSYPSGMGGTSGHVDTPVQFGKVELRNFMKFP